MLPLCILFNKKDNYALVYRLRKEYNRGKSDVGYDQARELITLPKMKAGQ
jgi:hypothetical protein